MDHHVVNHRQGAGGDGPGRGFHFHKAHAAVSGNGQAFVVAKTGNLDAHRLAGLKHGQPGSHFDFNVIDGDLRHVSPSSDRFGDIFGIVGSGSAGRRADGEIMDADAALECVSAFAKTACVIVKHANPCGVAVAETTLSAYEGAYETDPTSAFGGIIAFNRPLDGDTVTEILTRQFVEVILAPEFTETAKTALAGKPNIRALEVPRIDANAFAQQNFKRVGGGLLVQDQDMGRILPDALKIVSKCSPSSSQLADLLFAWTVAKFVKSNAIVYARDQQTIGVGAGQMSRVYSARIAGIKAADEKLQVVGSVMASDAFFPFRDGIDAAAKAGIQAVIQPGGSQRDDEVIQAADEHGIAMVFTGMRHFRH